MQLAALLYILGWLTAGFGGFLLIPMAVSAVVQAPDTGVFIGFSALYMVMGLTFVFGCRPERILLSHKDGILLTVLSWVWLSFLGALPLYFALVAQGVPTPFLHAFFEATSGLTTTGATVLRGLDDMTAGVLLWRSLLQWLGGMGILVLAVAILPFLGVGGMQLYRSELPGVTKDKLQPRLIQTAQNLWLVYTGLTFLCAVCYGVAGMGVFDAMNHAMTTVSTAGFSTRDQSFMAFESVGIDLVAMAFMVLGGLNFALHFKVVQQRSLQGYGQNTEIKVFFLIMLLAVVIMMTKLMAAEVQLPAYAPAVHYALFNTVSILTSTGYSNADFAAWPAAAVLVLLLMMFIGGCSGSTAGGMKVLRVLLVLKQGAREMHRLLHPASIQHVKMDNVVVPPQVIQAVWAFAGMYIVTFMLASLVLATLGLDIVTAFAAAAATLTNVGPGLGQVGPYAGYGHLSDPILIVLCVTMLLGRLELFTVLILFFPGFWRR